MHSVALEKAFLTILDDSCQFYVPLPPSLDQCAALDCPSHAECRLFSTGEAYCDPSCVVDNGGCAEDETCQLLATPCAAPPPNAPPSPCPLVVTCTPVATPTPGDYNNYASCSFFVIVVYTFLRANLDH